MKMTGAKAIIESLKKEKVDTIFGFPGGAVLPIFDELYEAPIRFILSGHEQGAAHMADGYARATGKAGVCIATSGPGATNLVTGIATAYMDSVPMVALTGQVPRKMIGNDAFQEAPITEITKAITKHNFLVQYAKELPEIMKSAFYIASSGRPGPVLIDIPKDVQTEELNFTYPGKVNLKSYKPVYKGHPGQIKKACQLIQKAKKPVLYIGGGIIISGAYELVRKLAEKTEIPVTTTLLGLGGFPSDHTLSLGMLGMHGTRYANYAVMESDLIIAIGARFDDSVTGKIDSFAPDAKIIHMDIDPTSISKSVKVDVPIVGDAKEILKDLINNIKKSATKNWLKKINEWKKKHPLA